MDSLPILTLALYLMNKGTSAKLEILRGKEKLNLDVPVFEPKQDRGRLTELSVPERDVIRAALSLEPPLLRRFRNFWVNCEFPLASSSPARW